MKMYSISSNGCLVFGEPMPSGLIKARARVKAQAVPVKTDKPKYAKTNTRSEWAYPTSINPRMWG